MNFYIFPSGPRSAEAAAAQAIRLGAPCFTDVKAVRLENGRAVLEKSIYSGGLLAEFRVSAPCCVALHEDFHGENPEGLIPADTIEKTLPPLPLEGIRSSYDPAGDELKGARLVIAAGRGIGSRQAFSRVSALAERLGAKAGATRSAVMYGWAPMSAQIGVSGVSIAAEVCLVLGASGAEAFSAGLEGCKTIIAVNTDAHAPIFRRADIGIVADCGEILTQLENLLE